MSEDRAEENGAVMSLALDTKALTIQTVYNWYSKGYFRVNRRYQRKLVWTIEEKRELISSIYREYPIPAIILSQDSDGHYEIIDGMQRLHCITSFIEQRFGDLDGKYFNVDEYPTARKRLELKGSESRSVDRADSIGGSAETDGDVETLDLIDADRVSSILEYSIPVSVLSNATDERVDDVFRRINSYGHLLSSQERRQAGVTGSFADTVRRISALLRLDSTPEVSQMENIPEVVLNFGLDEMEKESVDLPRQKQGYSIAAEETFWVRSGILNSREIRDSKDEECIAEILASVLLGRPISRTVDELDDLYDSESELSRKVSTALQSYGAEKVSREIAYTIDEIDRVAQASNSKLKKLLFFGKNGKVRNANSFPNIFGALVFAFYKMLIVGEKKIVDYSKASHSLERIADSLDSTQSGAKAEGRMKIANTFVGRVQDYLVDTSPGEREFISSGLELETLIRRSQVELSSLEFKQGMLSLSSSRDIDHRVVDKVLTTICAIANIVPERESVAGTIVVGVADKFPDTVRIEDLDGVVSEQIASKYVVGIDRELGILEWSPERYLQFWRDSVLNSELSSVVAGDVVNSMNIATLRGYRVLVIDVPSKKVPCNIGPHFYQRKGDQTLRVEGADIASFMSRFV
jgi:hypothetical protein